MRRRFSASAIACGNLLLGACDSNPTTAALRTCQAIAQGTPASTILPLGSTVTIGVTAEGGCPPTIVRNETPAIIQLDSDGTTYRVTAKSIGEGHVRIRSGVDTLVTQVLSMTVVAP